MTLAYLLPFALGMVFSVALFLFLGRKGYQEDGKTYSFFADFPYELFGDSRGVWRLFARIFEGLALALFILFPLKLLLSYASSYQGYAPSYLGGLLAFASLFALSFFFLSLIPASKEKLHLSLFFLSAAFNTLTLSSEASFLIVVIRSSVGKEGFYVLAGFLFLLAVASIALTMNPRLKRWAELEKVDEKDGTVSYQRPKFFVLAYSEWLLFAIAILGYLLALFGYFTIAL